MTEEYKLELDLKAKWIKIPRYRIWADGELMCERTYWPDPDQFHISENIIVLIAPGKHLISLEVIDSSEGKVWIHRARISKISTNTTHELSLGEPSYTNIQELAFDV